jgi:hypothetical protein
MRVNKSNIEVAAIERSFLRATTPGKNGELGYAVEHGSHLLQLRTFATLRDPAAAGVPTPLSVGS